MRNCVGIDRTVGNKAMSCIVNGDDWGRSSREFLVCSTGVSTRLSRQQTTASIVHRDVKPDNFMVKNDVVKLTDFGLSAVLGKEHALA